MPARPIKSTPSNLAPLAAHRSLGLRGSIRVPGDKSLSHRALILGLLTVGETTIEGLPESGDVLATMEACRVLGATATRVGEGSWLIRGVGVGGLLSPPHGLDFGDSGTGAALMMGAVASNGVTVTFDGDASLRRKPMERVLTPLLKMGAEIVTCAAGHHLPLTLRGASDPVPITYETPYASAQVKSAILLAGLNAPGETSVIEPQATPDHTERLLRHFGAGIEVTLHGAHGRRIVLCGRPELKPRPVHIPGDPSSAAFPLVAALIVPGSEIVIEGVMMNPLRNGLIATLKEMGADIGVLNHRIDGGEDVADLAVRHSMLRGVEVPAERASAMIDEYPVLAVAAAFAEGQTRMRGLGAPWMKEGDSLAAIATGLGANGVVHGIDGDDFSVCGAAKVAGGSEVATHADPRIAMAFLVMGLASQAPVRVDDGGLIPASFPGFAPTMSSLGAVIA